MRERKEEREAKKEKVSIRIFKRWYTVSTKHLGEHAA